MVINGGHMERFSLTLLGGQMVTTHARTQEKALGAYKMLYPDAQVTACEWVPE